MYVYCVYPVMSNVQHICQILLQRAKTSVNSIFFTMTTDLLQFRQTLTPNVISSTPRHKLDSNSQH